MARKKAASLGKVAGEQVVEEVAYNPTLLRWEVQMDILPTMTIEAATEQDAIDAYFKMCGVLSTEIRVNTKRLPAT